MTVLLFHANNVFVDLHQFEISNEVSVFIIFIVLEYWNIDRPFNQL